MIYLDHNATTPALPEVVDAVRTWMERPANPSSIHRPGQAAAAAVARAAEQVAALVGANPKHVVFTSGATEANHLWAQQVRGLRVAVSATEHPSNQPAGAETIPVDGHGQPSLGGVQAQVVSIQAANHETGVVLVHPWEGPLHTDASAAAGRMRLALQGSVTLSAHKIGGPLGVGALIHDDVEAVFRGSQQRGRRGGTVNTPAVVGFGVAARLALEQLDTRRARWADLQRELLEGVERLGGRVVGPPGLPTVVNAVFSGLPAELVVQALDGQGVCASAGAACASGSVGDSPVLRAMGDPQPDGGVRFSLGWSTTDAEIRGALAALEKVLELLDPLRS